MHGCRTGKRRLPGLLPAGSVVAHKTGSLEFGLSADIGIIALGRSGGTVAVAAFVVGSGDTQEQQDYVIARVGRAAYDYFSAQSAQPMSSRGVAAPPLSRPRSMS